jgi:hypothetical protein
MVSAKLTSQSKFSRNPAKNDFPTCFVVCYVAAMFEESVTWNKIISNCYRASSETAQGVIFENIPMTFCFHITKELPVTGIRNWLHDEIDAHYELNGIYLKPKDKIVGVRFCFGTIADHMRFTLSWK